MGIVPENVPNNKTSFERFAKNLSLIQGYSHICSLGGATTFSDRASVKQMKREEFPDLPHHWQEFLESSCQAIVFTATLRLVTGRNQDCGHAYMLLLYLRSIFDGFLGLVALTQTPMYHDNQMMAPGKNGRYFLLGF